MLDKHDHSGLAGQRGNFLGGLSFADGCANIIIDDQNFKNSGLTAISQSTAIRTFDQISALVAHRLCVGLERLKFAANR